MGISFAKSVRFGAVRFNFSGSGIGMSIGIPGLRIGTGPRGAYIGGGIAGFRYRKSLGNGTAQGSASHRHSPANAPQVALVPSANIVSTVVHEEKGVLELTDSTSDALIQSMNEQRQKTAWWPFVAVVLVLLLLFVQSEGNQWPPFVLPALFLLSLALIVWTYWRDQLRKLTVLFFEPDSATTAHFEAISKGAIAAASSRRIQAVAATSTYSDTKYSAGATSGLKLTKATCSTGQAPGVIANVDVPVLQASKITLAFYPDRVLAFQGNSVGSIEYADLRVENGPVTFVESGSVPSDATITGQTWQYVNKKGGPDKRFKNNRQMPECRYNRLQISTDRGLDIRLMSSRDGGFDELVRVLGARKAVSFGPV